MARNLQELERLSESLSYIYIERAIVERDNNSLVIIRENDRIPIPVSALTVLLLGPGTTITHAAINVISSSGGTVLWCGENGVRYYASGAGETRSSTRLLMQVRHYSDSNLHMDVVRKMYALRFPNIVTRDMELNVLRGIEGVRVREIYKQLSKIYGVRWNGRDYDLKDSEFTDPINQAISTANSCLYGLCHSAIVSLGYSPGIGFIHTGRHMSFVYDIADLYKMETVVPAAFKVIGSNKSSDINRDVRIACREMFKDKKLLKRIAVDIANLFDNENQASLDPPTGLWEEDGEESQGGKNFGGELKW